MQPSAGPSIEPKEQQGGDQRPGEKTGDAQGLWRGVHGAALKQGPMAAACDRGNTHAQTRMLAACLRCGKSGREVGVAGGVTALAEEDELVGEGIGRNLAGEQLPCGDAHCRLSSPCSDEDGLQVGVRDSRDAVG